MLTQESSFILLPYRKTGLMSVFIAYFQGHSGVNQVCLFAWVSFWALFFIFIFGLFLHLSHFLPCHSWSWYSHSKSLYLIRQLPPSSSSFFRGLLTVHGSLLFHINIRICLQAPRNALLRSCLELHWVWRSVLREMMYLWYWNFLSQKMALLYIYLGLFKCLSVWIYNFS